MRILGLATLLLAVPLLPLAASDPNKVRVSPDFVVAMPDKTELHVNSYKGKVVLLEFVYTTCPHCQNQTMMTDKLQDEYGPRGFRAVAVAFNEMAQMLVPDFIRDFRLRFPVGSSARGPVLAYLGISEMERFVVPQIVLIDKKGVIRMQSAPMGDERLQTESFLRGQIETMLKEPAAATPRTTATNRKQ